MPRVLEILSLSVLSLIINSVYCTKSLQIVTCQQHGEAVLSFHFPFISGAEDLDVSIMKMELIDGETNTTVIYVIDKGTEEYYADQYRNRTEIRNDLPSGKLDLILKHVEESDAGIYKCQAANKKNHEEKMIQLYIKRSTYTVTCLQHGAAVLSFHFSFISGADDLDVTIMKMESIDGDTKPTVIYNVDKAAKEYHAAQYRNRAEIRNDLPSGKLDLILKHLEESDAGIYKCQAANKKNRDEKMIQLQIERSLNLLMLLTRLQDSKRLYPTPPHLYIGSVSVKPAEIMAAEGESVTFQTDFSGPRTEVVWKIGEDKLVEVDVRGPYYYCLADRASASFHSGSLTIRDLVESDSGHYSQNILTEGKYHETKFILKVSPAKPKIHYNVTNGAITVYCESNSTGVMYEWRNSSGDLLSTGTVYTAPPETLRINNTVTCIVTNKVSESSSSVTIHHLPEENTNTNRNGIYLIPIIVSSLTLVFLGVILIIFLWYKMRSLRSSRKSQEYPEESHVSPYSDNL